MDSDRSTGVIQCKYCQCDYAIRPLYHSYTARDDTGIRTITDECSGHIACFWEKKNGNPISHGVPVRLTKKIYTNLPTSVFPYFIITLRAD